MKRKFVIGILGLLCLTVIAAGVLEYYGVFQTTINVVQPITIEGDLTDTIYCESGDSCFGQEITISNSADEERIVTLNTTAYENGSVVEGIETSYIGQVDLTTKDVINWTPTHELDATVYFAVVNGEFIYNIETEDDLTGYVLIYAKDHEDRFGNPAEFIRADEIASDLPDENDWNRIADPNYCNYNNTFDDYEHCYGAKLWLVPVSDLVPGGEISWENWESYLWETDLIWYSHNENNELTIPANSFIRFNPLYSLDPLLESGEYTLNTTIN